MPYSIWPTSPVPANIQRGIMWGESVQTYDSGAEQASTPWAKPLLQYTISLTNIPRTKQTSLHAFYRDICKAKTVPFLFADPYDYQIGGAVCVYSSATAVTSFFVRTREGYPVIPTSGQLVITSSLSGLRVQGTHYQFNPDTGVFSANAPISGDTWTASCQYFRKCKFESYDETSTIWNQFSGTVVFHEIALP